MAGKDMTLRMVMKLAANDFTRGISGIQKQLQGLGNYLKTAFAVGSVATFGREMIKWTREFEDAMARAKAVSNASSEGFNMMREEALRLGATTRYTSVQVAQTLEVLTRNGLSATNATRVLADVLKLAQANAVELADAGNMVVNVSNMFNLSVQKAAYVTDILSATASNSATDLTSLYEAMTNAAPMANALGMEINEVAAALGALANVGVKGPDAGTQLRQFLQRLTDPLAMKKMQKLTGFSFDEAFINEKGLKGVLEKLQSLNLSVSQLNDIFTVRSSKSIIQLMNSMRSFNALLGVMENSAGTASRMFVEGVGNMRYELDILRSMWQNWMIQIGTANEGPFLFIVKTIQDVITTLQNWGTALLQLIPVFMIFHKRIYGGFTDLLYAADAWAKGDIIATNLALAEKKKAHYQQMLQNKQLDAAQKSLLANGVARQRQIIAGYKAQQSAAQALKTTLKTIGWGAAIIGVELLISKLVAMNAEMRRAKEAEAEVDRETQNLLSKTKMLVAMIDSGNENSINGAVNEACRTFSDFAVAIRLAAEEAGKTGEYEKLKATLKDIASLQVQIMKTKSKQGLVDATREKYASTLKYGGGDVRDMINKSLKEKGYNSRGIDVIYDQIAEILIRNNKNIESAVDELYSYLTGTVNISKSKLDKWVREMTQTSITNSSGKVEKGGTYYRATNAYNELQSLLTDSTRREDLVKWNNAMYEFNLSAKDASEKYKVGSKEYKEAMTAAYTNFRNSIGDLAKTLKNVKDDSGNDKYIRMRDILASLEEKYGGKGQSSGTGGEEGGSGSKKKTPQDKFNDVIQDYIDDSKKVEAQYKNGIIIQEQYRKALSDVELEALKTVAGVDELDKMLKGLPESSKEAGNSLAGMVKDFNKKAAENILLGFDEKQAQIKTAYENSPKDAASLKTYNDAMDDLATETMDELSKIQDLNTVIGLLSQALRDLYGTITSNIAAQKEKTKSEQLRNLEQNTRIDVKEPELKVKLSKDDTSVEGLKQALQRELDKEHFDLNFDIANDETLLDNVNDRIKDVDGGIKYLEEQLRKFEAGEDNDIDLVKDEAVKKLLELKAQLKQLMKLSKDLESKVEISKIIIKVDDSLEKLTDKAIDSVSSLSSAFDKLKDSVKDIAEAFDVELEFEGLEKGITVVNAIIQAIESVKTIMETFQAFQEMANKRQIRQNAEVALSNAAVAASEGIKASAVATGATVNAVETATSEASTTANKKRAKSNLMVAASETIKAGASGSAAAAEGAESVAKIPYVGAALAVAAAAAIAGALVAAFSKIKGFQNGGFVGGNSYYGDKNLIRANTGELVLTRGDQRTLYRAIKTGNLGGGNGNVEFIIRGDQLVGTLNNWNRIHR